MDGQVRTQKEFEQERNTHSLKSVDRQTSQDMERIQASEGHSPTGEQRWTDKSEHGKNPTEQGALTNWRVQMDGQVSTQKESKQVRDTHRLESAQMDKSGYRMNLSEEIVLTSWRAQKDGQVRT